MLLKSQSKEAKVRKVTPPSPSYMSNDQFSAYLSGLRSNRVARPGGARPYPGSTSSSRRTMMAETPKPTPKPTTTPSTAAAASVITRALASPSEFATTGHKRANSDESNVSSTPSQFPGSISSRYSASTYQAGQDYIPKGPTPPLNLGKAVPSATYIERGQRWMEKEEACSLRRAMQDLDMEKNTKESAERTCDDDDEARIHEAALDEAAELVWQHQNGYKPPELGAPYKYKPHLRKNSYAHARTASVGPHPDEFAPTGLGRDMPRSVSGSSSGSDRRASFDPPVRWSLDSTTSRRPRIPATQVAPIKGRRRGSMKRNITGEVERPFCGDQIWEEPDGQAKEGIPPQAKGGMSKVSKQCLDPTHGETPVLKESPKSPLNTLGEMGAGVGGGSCRQEQASSTPGRRALPWLANRDKGLERTEIHRNPPSQSRNPAYTRNWPGGAKRAEEDNTPKKNGMEVRGDDIIQATSMRLKDRSAKLPAPTAVSDSPGRPIVSFDANWKAPEEKTDLKIDETPISSTLFPSQKQHNTAVPSINMAQLSEPLARVPGSLSSSYQPPSVSLNTSSPSTGTNPSGRPVPGRGSFLSRSAFSSMSPTTPTGPAIAISAAAHTHEITLPTVNTMANMKGQPRSQAMPVPVPIIITPDGNAGSDFDCYPTSRDTKPLPQIATSNSGDDHINGAKRPTVSPSIPIIVAPHDNPQPPPRSRPLPQISVSPSEAPSEAPNEAPNSRKLPRPPVIPSIITPGGECNNASGASRPLPTPGNRGTPAGMQRRRGHWSPATSHSTRATATCHECHLPIEGRFVALSGVGERFHPQCFRCHACGTGLEALEISPEPDNRRAERLERIRRRAQGEIIPEVEGKMAAEDGDERLRFFCHLDWHEMYAPKCKHCTTPIMGEHVVALGEHWHYGHFFCAECGDPFEQGMTHIEKDGYAWCVKCQTKRTERRAPKCKKCRNAVIGQYIRALGGEWHDECFRCVTCHGGFDDGQVFPREQGDDGMVVLCTKCRQTELKA